MQLPPVEVIAAIGIVIFFAIGIHEYCHAKFADMAGDPTPATYGRVTLNLTKHFEPLGTIMIVVTSLTGFGIGWGKPVPMNPSRMRNPRIDHLVAVAAGPISNLIQATIFGLVLRLLALGVGLEAVPSFLLTLLVFGVMINLALFFFNCIPLGPLDGMWIVSSFMNNMTRQRWVQFNLTTGGILLLALILFSQFSGTGIIRLLVIAPARSMFRILTGVEF